MTLCALGLMSIPPIELKIECFPLAARVQQTLAAETVVWKQGILVMPRIVHQVNSLRHPRVADPAAYLQIASACSSTWQTGCPRKLADDPMRDRAKLGSPTTQPRAVAHLIRGGGMSMTAWAVSIMVLTQ